MFSPEYVFLQGLRKDDLLVYSQFLCIIQPSSDAIKAPKIVYSAYLGGRHIGFTPQCQFKGHQHRSSMCIWWPPSLGYRHEMLHKATKSVFSASRGGRGFRPTSTKYFKKQPKVPFQRSLVAAEPGLHPRKILKATKSAFSASRGGRGSRPPSTKDFKKQPKEPFQRSLVAVTIKQHPHRHSKGHQLRTFMCVWWPVYQWG